MTRWAIASVAALVIAAAGYIALFYRPAPSEPVLTDTAPLAGLHLTVTKSPTCGCCGGWIDIMKAHGAEITTIDTDDIVSIKIEHGVPNTQYSCHTAEVDGYVVEGHVPVEAIVDLVTQRPDIRGIALGGMPQGSPGMDGVKAEPFEIVAFTDDEVRLFGRY